MPARQIDRAVDILGVAAVEGITSARLISIDPNSYPWNSGDGAKGRSSHFDPRSGANIDCAVVRSGTAGENKGHARPIDGAAADDRKVASVQDVSARIEVERGAAGHFDPPAINPRRNGFGFALVQPVTCSDASRTGWKFEAGVGIGNR